MDEWDSYNLKRIADALEASLAISKENHAISVEALRVQKELAEETKALQAATRRQLRGMH